MTLVSPCLGPESTERLLHQITLVAAFSAQAEHVHVALLLLCVQMYTFIRLVSWQCCSNPEGLQMLCMCLKSLTTDTCIGLYIHNPALIFSSASVPQSTFRACLITAEAG